MAKLRTRNNTEKTAWWRLSLPFIRDLLLTMFFIVLGWKVATAEWTINLEKFGFSELLATLLAFFAIALSVAFYFTANETSNNFYDNVYHFTKDTSEILGRIEAGFGERLRHLDEGYSGLRDRFDKIPFDINEAKKEVKKEEEEVERTEAERNKLLNTLARRAQLAEGEKEDLFAQLRAQDEQLAQAKSELQRLQHRIQSVESSKGVGRELVDYLWSTLNTRTERNLAELSPSALQEFFDVDVLDLNPRAVRDMIRAGLLDENKSLTTKGEDLIRAMFNTRR